MGNNKGTEAQKYVWEGAIPLQIHLHESEVTTLPRPPPALVPTYLLRLQRDWIYFNCLHLCSLFLFHPFQRQVTVLVDGSSGIKFI